MKTYRVYCAGFESDSLPSIAAVQAWIDSLKSRSNVKGETLRVYRFINGSTKAVPALVGVVS
jgi:hypothetical protein